MATKKTALVISLVVAGIIFASGGFFCGVLSEKQRVAPDIAKISNLQRVENIVSSKVVSSIIARGKVSKISGKTITLTSNSESIDIFVRENTVFLSRFTPGADGKLPKTTVLEKPLGFSDIKIGSTLSATIIISPAGAAEAVSVAIFSAGS